MLKICALKGTIKRVKRQPTKWEKILANHMSETDLIGGIYREFPKFMNDNNNKQPDSKMGKGIE